MISPRLGPLVLLPALIGVTAPRLFQQQTSERTLVVAATTDVHGRMHGWDYYTGTSDSLRGLARVATIVDSLRAAHRAGVVLVDAGDLLQGTPLTHVAARANNARSGAAKHPVIAAMNAMRYDAAAVGNHDFDYGLALLRRAAGEAAFPFLSANIRRSRGGKGPFPAYRIVQRSGVQVGIVGATTPGTMVWNNDDLGGLVVEDIVPAVKQNVANVRRAGADVVVVVMHAGLDQPATYDTVSSGVPGENVGARIAREIPGVDMVVLGHTHREVGDTVINGVLLVQPGFWATTVAVGELQLQRQGKAWRVTGRRGRVVRAVGHAEHPRVLQVTQRAHAAAVAYANRVIGTTNVAWRADSGRIKDTPLVDFVNEVMRRKAGAQLSAGPAYSLDVSLDSGAITVAEVARLYPYENTIRAVRVTGRQLRGYLEHASRYYRTLGEPAAATSLVDPSVPGYNFDIITGATYVLDLTRPVGQRVTRLEVGGRPVRDDDAFTLALNNYRQSGGGNFSMIRGAPVVYEGQDGVRELLIEEVERRKELRPSDYFVENWRLEPDSAVGRAYRSLRALATAGGPSANLPQGSGRRLRLITTNDFHGALEPRRDSEGVNRGGAAWLAAEIARARRECPPPSCQSLLLDGGDIYQGTAASNFAFGRPVIALFNHLGYAAAALGNHEFDWSQDTLRARMRDARFPILGANVTDTAGRNIAWIPDDTLFNLGGLRVGVIGIADPATPQTTRASLVADLRFADPAPVIDARARALRARGANVVVVVAHMGGFCDRGAACRGEILNVAERIREPIDAIVAGHTHAPIATHVRGIPIVQARARGTTLGIIDIPIGDRGTPATVVLRDVIAEGAPPDREVHALVESATASLRERMERPIVQIAERIEMGIDRPMGNLIADAQRTVGKGDVAIMNSGGVRAPLAAGTATFGALYEVHPFGNVLMRITVRGRELRNYLERLVSKERINFHLSGVVMRYDPARRPGDRLVEARLSSGAPIDDDRPYRLVMTDFLASGGDGLNLTERAIAVEELGIVDLDALIEYLRSLPSPVRAPTDRRLIPLSR